MEEPSITISRRLLLRGALGAAGAVGAVVAAKKLATIDIARLREKLPGLDVALDMWEGREVTVDPADDNLLRALESLGVMEMAMRRRLADLDAMTLGNLEKGTTREQYELILRWLDGFYVYAALRIAAGVGPYAPDLYEGIQDYLEEHRAEWDGGLTETVRRQLEEEREEDGQAD